MLRLIIVNGLFFCIVVNWGLETSFEVSAWAGSVWMLLWRINKVSDVGYEIKCVSLFENWWPSWAKEDGNLGCSDTDAQAYLLTKTFFTSSVMPLKLIFHCIQYSISIEKCIPPTLRRQYFGLLSLIREGHQKKSPKTDTVYWIIYVNYIVVLIVDTIVVLQ